MWRPRPTEYCTIPGAFRVPLQVRVYHRHLARHRTDKGPRLTVPFIENTPAENHRNVSVSSANATYIGFTMLGCISAGRRAASMSLYGFQTYHGRLLCREEGSCLCGRSPLDLLIGVRARNPRSRSKVASNPGKVTNAVRADCTASSTEIHGILVYTQVYI